MKNDNEKEELKKTGKRNTWLFVSRMDFNYYKNLVITKM
jgi:hypothetical protein